MYSLPKPLLAVDLFAGAGGLTLGLKQAGFFVVGAVEIDPVARETYKMNHPEIEHLWEDIKSVTGQGVLEKLGLVKGELDLLAGCPPCQGFSMMRTRNLKTAVKDSRNDLIFDYLRLVRDLEPRAVMLENVPGLLKDKRMRHVLSALKKWGYYAEPDAAKILDAADFGVPQRRKRLILMTTKSGCITFPNKTERTNTVIRAIGSTRRPGRGDDPLHDYAEKRTPRVRTLIENVPKNGGSRADLPREFWLECHKKFGGFSDVYGRMAWREVSPTITSGCLNPSKGRFIHPEQNRAITLREAALLQGFPSDYQFSLRKGREFGAVMIGNALPPEFVRRHATSIRNHLLSTRIGQ